MEAEKERRELEEKLEKAKRFNDELMNKKRNDYSRKES